MTEQNYVVVGGSRGIGLAIVDRLVAAGHRVTVLSRTEGELAGRENVKHIGFDVTKDECSADMLPDQIHGMAYCPGSINLRSFKSLKPQVFRDDFELNVIGAVKTIQAASNGLTAAYTNGQPASVLLFSTVAVGQGMFAHASVAASKGAVEGLARTLAAEFAPKIRVNCIAPALTNTSLTERFFSSEEKARAMAEKYPMKRSGTVDDIAGMGCYLLSSASGWITGQVIGIDGGMSTVHQ